MRFITRHLHPNGDEFGIAGVGGVVSKYQGPVGSLTQDLVHQAELELPESAATELDGKVRCPQASSLDLLLEWLDQCHHLVVAECQCLDREDFLAHEGAHPRQLLFELRVCLEVPGH